MKILNKVSYLILLLVCANVSAQDVHFSQYFTSPLTLNPAMTGLVNKDFRVAANYRTQWSSITNNPYETFTFSVDGSLFKNKFNNGDAVGLGIIFLNDKAGAGQLTNQTMGLSLAYHHALGKDKNQHISLGFQAYAVNKFVDFRKLVFGDQFDPVSGTANGTTGETWTDNEEGYSDFNTGIMYTGRINDKTSIYGGLSAYHITQPNETFQGGANKIHSRYNAYLGSSFDLTDYTVAYVSGNIQRQGSQSEFILGGATGFILNPNHDYDDNDKVFYVGAWYRYNDAIIPYIGFELDALTFGLTYDATVSNLATPTNYQGAYEMSLIWNARYPKSDPKRRYDFSCPKF